MTKQTPIDFADMDDFDNVHTKPAKAKQEMPVINCPACGGRGTRIFGYVNISERECYTCKGTGKVKADWQKRREAFKKAQTTKAHNEAVRLNKFAAEFPAEWKWIQDSRSTFDFAAAMADAVQRFGVLTERQLAAVQGAIAKQAARKAERVVQQNARSVAIDSVQTILDTLHTAVSNGLKRPKLRTEVATFSLAPSSGKNGGCVYVVDGEQYLGKITPEGMFQPVRECTNEQRSAVAKVAENVLDAAKLFGKQTGTCSCCGRELTDPASIEAGIGPICEGKFFG